MIRKLKIPLLLATLVIATLFLNGCNEKMFLTVVAEPPTIAPSETSIITVIVTAGKNAATAKPVKDAKVTIWLPSKERVLAKLSSTTVMTDEQGNASVKLTASDVSPKTVHLTAQVKDTANKCVVAIRKTSQ